MGKKREIPELLQNILDYDVMVTEKCVKVVDKKCGPLSKYDKVFKSLEVSCHGIPWLVATATLIFLSSGDVVRQWSVNVFIVLILDIIVVAVIKALTRRRRPSEMSGSIGVDKFSFPSGHATRAMMFAILFPMKYDLFFPISCLALLWGISVSISRVLLRRHHILDVAAGVVIGIVEALLYGQLVWLSTDSANNFVAMFMDETQVGASYDV